jgi:excisionase family DNA binding protein
MNDIMTLEEVAAYLKLKPQTIYTWAQDGKIPAAKLGKEWRFRKSVIDRWFNRHIDEKFSVFLEPHIPASPEAGQEVLISNDIP